MRSFYFCCLSCVLLILPNCLCGQTLQHRPMDQSGPSVPSQPTSDSGIPLIVRAGTPIKVALDRDARIHRAGQPVRGKTTEPIYAFDKLLVPAGTVATGRIAGIEDVPKMTRTLAAMNADFSPVHKVHVEFDQLVLRDGRRIRINTVGSPGAGVLQFVSAKETKHGKVKEGKATVKKRFTQAKSDLKQQLVTAKNQISAPDKLHRLEKFALAESPYRPQYLGAGTSFNADLQQQLEFGSESLRPETIANVGTLPRSGGVIRAWLSTPHSSSTSKRDNPVEAIVSEPLIVGGQLYLPQGTRLQGTVLQVRHARWLGRNGQLRITFHRMVLPDGPMREVDATLEGLEVVRGENLALDSEGGAQVRISRSRYLSTGIALALAAGSARPDEDNGGVHEGGLSGGTTGGAANGAVGFKLVGTLVGVLAHSQVVTAGLGAFGAAHSVYSHFLARGRDVVYPKDMSMLLAVSNPGEARDRSTETKSAGSD